MSEGYLLTLVAPIASLLGVLLGSYLSKNNKIRLEKEFLARKIRIEKYQELFRDLGEYMRSIGIVFSALVKLEKKEITIEQFREINDQQQEKRLEFQRRLNVNMVFVDELKEKYDELFILSNIFNDKVYEGFQSPNTRVRYFSDDEVDLKSIEDEFIKLGHVSGAMFDWLANKLNEELKDLEK